MNSLVSNILSKPNSSGLLPYTGSELLRWWDPSDSLNVTKSSGRFDQVNDKSGNSGHIASTSAFRPFDSRTINGKEVLDFQAGQKIDSISTTGSLAVSVIMIAAKFDNSNIAYLFDDPTIANRQVIYCSAIPDFIMFGGNNLSSAVFNTNMNIFTCVFNGASSIFYINGILVVSGNVGGRVSTSFRLGSGGAGSPTLFIDGAVGDTLIYNSLIDNSKKNQTGQYLANKWGVSYTDIT